MQMPCRRQRSVLGSPEARAPINLRSEGETGRETELHWVHLGSPVTGKNLPQLF